MSPAAAARPDAMGQLILHISTTLDGCIDEPQHWADLGEAAQAHTAELYAQAEAMVLGRHCFEGFAAVWPGMRDASPIGPFINDLPKWVASTTLEGELDWNGRLLDRGDPLGHLARIKAQTAGTLISTGMGTLAADLVGAGLVDELRLAVHPVVRGHGHRLFHDALRDQRFEVLRTAPVASAQEVVLRPVPAPAGA